MYYNAFWKAHTFKKEVEYLPLLTPAQLSASLLLDLVF